MKWTQGIVQRKHVWANGLFTLEVKAPDVKSFTAGQFLQLGLEQADGHLHRPYSVASPHGEVLDFFIVLVEDGALTPHLWKLEEGDRLDVSERAAGSFTLAHCPDAKDLWLVATGTGLAPYIAMLRTPEPWERFEHIAVVHGVRYTSDLAYIEELRAHEAAHPERFKYVPMVSREDFPGALRGRITHSIPNGKLEEVAQQPFSTDSCIMMCGNPDMLNEAEAIFLERGIHRHKRKDPGQIVVERYW